MSKPTPAAEQLKGNALYQKAKYSAAIDAYTEAITLCPRWILPIINRALCQRKKKNWTAVREDCEKALDIDRESIKANYMLGLSLIYEKKHSECWRCVSGAAVDLTSEAAARLTKALEYARASEAETSVHSFNASDA